MFESSGRESTKQVEIQTFPFIRRENYKIMKKKDCLDMQVVSKWASGKHTVTYMEFKSLPFTQTPLFLPYKTWRKPEIRSFSLLGLS